jgi:long-subunit acyl-CoA synthetase (AMP-forming)
MMQHSETTDNRGLLHTIFESQVSSSPNRNAIQTYTLGSCQTITYHELNSEANMIARQIRSTKLPQVIRFAICMDKGPNLVAIILAVLKLGCAWSPIDPKAPVKRKIAILQELGSCHLLVAPEYAADFQHCPSSTSIFVWDDLISRAASVQDGDNLQGVDCNPDSPCHILWTSGSTGVPKGQFKSPVPSFFVSRLIQTHIRGGYFPPIRCK